MTWIFFHISSKQQLFLSTVLSPEHLPCQAPGNVSSGHLLCLCLEHLPQLQAPNHSSTVPVIWVGSHVDFVSFLERTRSCFLYVFKSILISVCLANAFRYHQMFASLLKAFSKTQAPVLTKTWISITCTHSPQHTSLHPQISSLFTCSTAMSLIGSFLYQAD